MIFAVEFVDSFDFIIYFRGFQYLWGRYIMKYLVKSSVYSNSNASVQSSVWYLCNWFLFLLQLEDEITNNPLSKPEGDVAQTSAEVLYATMLPSLPQVSNSKNLKFKSV